MAPACAELGSTTRAADVDVGLLHNAPKPFQVPRPSKRWKARMHCIQWLRLKLRHHTSRHCSAHPAQPWAWRSALALVLFWKTATSSKALHHSCCRHGSPSARRATTLKPSSGPSSCDIWSDNLEPPVCTHSTIILPPHRNWPTLTFVCQARSCGEHPLISPSC